MERKFLGELNEFVERAQHVLAEYLPPDSGKSEKEALAELLGILDSRGLHRLQGEINELIGRRSAFFGH
jgi:hypothetical protein